MMMAASIDAFCRLVVSGDDADAVTQSVCLAKGVRWRAAHCNAFCLELVMDGHSVSY